MKYDLQLPEGYIPPPLPGRDEWLAALRSGAYTQARDVLCRATVSHADPTDPETSSHCCLGVLCRVQKRPSNRVGTRLAFDRWDSTLSSSNPSRKYLKHDGSFPPGARVRMTTELTSLAACNDQGLTFLEIADIIEKVWSNAEKNW